ncbi:hypothetical protein ACHAXS_013587 [Conticribra weissflogii]
MWRSRRMARQPRRRGGSRNGRGARNGDSFQNHVGITGGRNNARYAPLAPRNFNNSNVNNNGSNSNCNSAAPPDTEPAMRVLAFCEHGSRIAFACYNEEDNEIVFEDAHAHNGNDTKAIIRGVLLETRPNLILVGLNVVSNEPLLECLTTMPLGIDEDEDGSGAKADASTCDAQDTTEQEGGDGNATATATATSSPLATSAERPRTIPYQLLKSAAFEPRACRSVILHKLRVMSLMKRPSTGNGTNNQYNESYATDSNLYDPITHESSLTSAHFNSYHSLSSIIDFDSPTLLRAIGSLLIYLRTTAFRLEEGFTVTIHNIRRCPAPHSFLRLDDSTLRTLRIFCTESHPLRASNSIRTKGGGGSLQKSKEGFSLFSLLDRTKSKAGKERLRQWMIQPLRDPVPLRQRHIGMELFLHPSTHPVTASVLERMGDIGSVDAILLRMQRCCTQTNDFLVLGRTLEAAFEILGCLGGELRKWALWLDQENDGNADSDDGNGAGSDELSEAMHVDNPPLNCSGVCGRNRQKESPSLAFVDNLVQRCHVSAIRNLRERMAAVIDEEVTAETKDHVVINYGFHEELDRAKETFETLDETLSEVGRQVLSKHEELISLKVVFLPQVGFLVSIDKRQHAHDETTNTFPNIPEDFRFIFIQDDDAFFKNSDMDQLDEEIGDLDAFIKDTEAMIVSDLEEEILECESEIRSTFSALADLDCIISLAVCAADLNYVKPEMLPAEDGVVYIENGRHPLQELIVDDEYIPNDTSMDNDNRVLVVTGPNFSGKSCYARQVGVLVYLAHVGSFLPCDCARISFRDQILVNFGDIETCSVPQSTFQRDLTQMASILRKSTERSLVLIDEFGKGTAPASGIAVITAALQRLAEIKCKVVCTTHFLEMFSLGLLEDCKNGIKAVQMSIHAPESNDDEAVPLFKLEDGVASSSAGLICARMAGLSDKLLGRANEIITALKEGKQVHPLAESLNANSPFQQNVKSAIRLFLAVDSWIDATTEDIDLLEDLINRI